MIRWPPGTAAAPTNSASRSPAWSVILPAIFPDGRRRQRPADRPAAPACGHSSRDADQHLHHGRWPSQAGGGLARRLPLPRYASLPRSAAGGGRGALRRAGGESRRRRSGAWRGRWTASARAISPARTGSTRKDEIGDVSRAFDRMADRISTLLTAERRLLQDISHELRSPLARLAFAAELALTAPDREAAVERVKKEIARLTIWWAD